LTGVAMLLGWLCAVLGFAGAAAQPGDSGGKDTVAQYVKQKYPDLSDVRIAAAPPNPAMAKVLPGRELYFLSRGGLYPIATAGPRVRRMLALDPQQQKVVVDFDATQNDADAAAALRALLPAVRGDEFAEVAAAAATLAPLDPFFANPGAPQFQARKGPGRRTTAIWQGAAFRYQVVFDGQGKLVAIERSDKRPKPVCYVHRARAQELLDRIAPGLRAGDVIWDDRRAPRACALRV
jgi:hypothetical protein